MTIMIRPSFEAGRPAKATDLRPKESRKYFAQGLDRFQVICPSGRREQGAAVIGAIAGAWLR